MRWSKWHLPKLLPLRSFQRTDPGLGIEPCQEGEVSCCVVLMKGRRRAPLQLLEVALKVGMKAWGIGIVKL